MMKIFKSIRFKIILWYMLILLATLSVFSAVVFHYFKHNLISDLDELLVSRAEGIGDAIDLQWRSGSERQPSLKFESESEGNPRPLEFRKFAEQWVSSESGEPKLLRFVIRIFDVRGHPIASTLSIRNDEDMETDALKALLKGKGRFANVTLMGREGPLQLRTFTKSVYVDGELSYFVQVASDMTVQQIALDRLRFILFIILPFIIFIAGVIGAFMARSTLSPVDDMIRTIREVSTDNLKLRVSIPDSKDELKNLADTFNDMLVRFDNSLTFQQQFIQDISHELKTPLTILKGQLGVALNSMRSPEEYENFLISSLEEVDKISHIVDDLLVLARFDNEDFELKKEPIDLAELLKDLMDDMSVLFEQKDIKWKLTSLSKGEIQGDRMHIRRALMNVLSNALKYTPRDGSISATLEKIKNDVKIKIEDTGVGISKKDLPRIFDRFFCINKARGSHGLGLCIVKSIIEAHSGQTHISSEEDQGTVVEIFFPTT